MIANWLLRHSDAFATASPRLQDHRLQIEPRPHDGQQIGMDIGKILRQLKAGGSQASADESVEHLAALAAGRLAIFVVEIGEVDEAFIGPLDHELFGIVLQRLTFSLPLQLGHDELREVVAAGRTKEEIEPSQGDLPTVDFYCIGRWG